MSETSHEGRARRPTIADVARRAGVSKGLVSFALNDRPGVNVATRDRILTVAAEMGWSPDVRARSLSTNRSFALGLVLQRDTEIVAGDPFFPAFIAGVERELRRPGRRSCWHPCRPGPLEADTYRKLASERRVDGVFLADLRAADERLALVESLGLAAVTLGHPDIDSPFPAVTVDDVDGMIADRRPPRRTRPPLASPTSPARRTCSTRADAGMRSCRRVRGARSRRPSRRDGLQRASRAPRRRPTLIADAATRPTAITYSNDQMALAGIAVAQRAGLSVPGDLSVAGFDDSDIARYVYPSLTSVATDAVEWGAAAARALLARDRRCRAR